uniref:Uncharacterized protein n=1 Tax=Picea glauca TaxID=3330 RepID=A0A101M2H7_PICGL|nr:hypothetical protein ABT39_MTgene3053 [Picea glauca]QHR87268.1 hypothetical protein Q903MT_gene1277 [Picea sitchensis]
MLQTRTPLPPIPLIRNASDSDPSLDLIRLGLMRNILFYRVDWSKIEASVKPTVINSIQIKSYFSYCMFTLSNKKLTASQSSGSAPEAMCEGRKASGYKVITVTIRFRTFGINTSHSFLICAGDRACVRVCGGIL